MMTITISEKPHAKERWIHLMRSDPQACLADVLKPIAEHPAKKLDQLLPWPWKVEKLKKAA